MQTGRFRPTDRIRLSREYGQLARRGRRKAARSFVMIVGSARRSGESTGCAAEMGDRPRLGITVSRRVGNAVERNRIKRCVREWFRAARGSWSREADVVVIARRGAAALTGAEIRRELDGLGEALGLFDTEGREGA